MSFFACKKKQAENPYDSIDRTVVTQNPSANALPEGSFPWLQARIFTPTCANSGCHDGTFEPDFRTMASSYNTLVNHPVIANNPEESFQLRVVPGNAQASWLHERLTVAVPNTSGIMPPLAQQQTPDWTANRDLYISKISQWINDGAKDMYGNPAPMAGTNLPPQVYGLAIYPHGDTTALYPRNPDSPNGIGEILVPAGLVDVWVFAVDDNAGVNQFSSITLKKSTSVNDFSFAPEVPFALDGPTHSYDFVSSPTTFYYKATLDLSGASQGQVFFLRTYLNDGVQTNLTEIPNSNSSYFWYLLFSIKIQ